MAKYPSISQTKNGRILIAKSNATGKALKPIKVVAGDGQLTNQNIETMENVINPLLELPFASPGRFVKEGQFQLDFALSNEHLEHGFYAREIGVFAKLDGEDDSTAVMIAYTNGGNFVDYIPAKDTPINSKVFEVTIAVDNAANVIVQRSDAAYITAGEMERHNTDEQAHSGLFQKVKTELETHNTDPTAHNDIINAMPQISILTGICNDGETIPLPDGYTEIQCKFFVSMASENPNGYWYDPAEGGARNMLKVECYTEGRILRCAMVYDGFDNWKTGRDSGSTVGPRIACRANYMVIGIKYGG